MRLLSLRSGRVSVKTNPHPAIHTTTSIRDTLRVSQRNLMTVGMPSCGRFPGTAGWWGKPSEAVDSLAIWGTVKAAREIISERMWPPSLLTAAATLPIEVALIIDDVSPSYFAAVGGPIPATDPDNGFSSLLHYMPAHELARAGIPYRNYLLTDLLLPAFQTDVLPTLKLVIFANALRVPASVVQYINGTLASCNRTLLWLWAAGVVKDDGQAGPTLDPTGPAVITGLPLVVGAGSIPLQADIDGFAFPYFGPGYYPIAPWFSLAQTLSGREVVPADVKVLARYHSNRRAAMISAKRAEHTVIFSGAIKIPTELYTRIAVDAGCHVYIKTAEDIVETGGQALMVVAGDPKLKAKRTVTLPTKVAKVEDGSGMLSGNGSVATVCVECAVFDTGMMAPGDVALFFVTPADALIKTDG